MLSLVKERHAFDPGFFGKSADLIQSTALNSPDILMVACSDHGTAPDNVSLVHPSRMYVVQHLGQTIPSKHDGFGNLIVGGIEFAVRWMNVRHAIVCGHSRCVVIRNWATRRLGEIAKTHLSQFDAQARSAVDASYPHASLAERVDLYIREHILYQVENLQSHPFIQHRLRSGSLRLHAWLVDESTARVSTFDPSTGQFSRSA